MKRKICDKVQSSQVKIEVPGLPDWIKEGIKETIAKNALQCLDPDRAKGSCLRITDQLMYNLSEVNKDRINPFVNCKILHSKKPQPHFWLLVDGWHIDLTARQFNPNEACPKIWKDGEVTLNNIYCVEKGKGLILFYLTPFNNGKAKNLSTFNRILNLIFSTPKTI